MRPGFAAAQPVVGATGLRSVPIMTAWNFDPSQVSEISAMFNGSGFTPDKLLFSQQIDATNRQQYRTDEVEISDEGGLITIQISKF